MKNAIISEAKRYIDLIPKNLNSRLHAESVKKKEVLKWSENKRDNKPKFREEKN
jgi:hypothetical protein